MNIDPMTDHSLDDEVEPSNFTQKLKNIVLWDDENEPPSFHGSTMVLWSSYRKFDKQDLISIPNFIEEHADTFKSKFLGWVYDLGETTINGRRVVDQLELRSGFSYWWITSIAQKFNASSTSQIDNAIKLMALDSLLEGQSPKSILLVTANKSLVSAIRRLSINLGIKFTWQQATSASIRNIPFMRRIYNVFPSPIRASIYLIWFVICRLGHIQPTKDPTEAVNSDITFIDVLVHLNKETFRTGKFISNYWTSLVDELSNYKIKTNWIHNYFTHQDVPNIIQAQELTKAFTRNSNGNQTHTIVESNTTSGVIFNVITDYLRLLVAGYRISKISHCFIPNGSRVDFWPLFKQEWIDSIRGQSAILNVYRLSLYEKVFLSMPYQKIGVYLQENQPWETVLIYSWKAAGHGKLIGVPHSTVRYWDLRYFYDSRSYTNSSTNSLPLPEIVAVNGPAAKKLYIDGGYQEHFLREVEALRYLHLITHKHLNSSRKYIPDTLNILICGDFLASTTCKMLSWLLLINSRLPSETNYIFKPHPAYQIDLSPFKSLKLKLSNASLSDLLKDCDIVFTSNITSAAVDAYCSGVPVLQMLDGNSLNVSPLRGLKGVEYICDHNELLDSILNAFKYTQLASEPYFYLDNNLYRWLTLLGLDSNSTYFKDQ